MEKKKLIDTLDTFDEQESERALIKSGDEGRMTPDTVCQICGKKATCGYCEEHWKEYLKRKD